MDNPIEPVRDGNENLPASRVPTGSWWGFATALAMGIILGIGLLATVRMLAQPLALLVLAVTLAVALDPVVDTLSTRMSRVLASLLVFLALILLIVVLGLIIVPELVAQAQALIDRIPRLIDLLQDWLSRWNINENGQLTSSLLSELGSLTGALVAVPLRIFTSLLDVLLLIFIALYWLILTPNIKRFFLSLFSTNQRRRVDRGLKNMGASMGGYARGTAINGFIVGLLTYIGLLIIGVDSPLVLGLLAGVLEIIPILGPLIAGIAVVLIALLDSPTTALIAAIYILTMQQLESNILVPNIMRSQANLSPLLVILAVYAGGVLGGLLGALAAIPVMAMLQVLVRDWIAPAVRKHTGAPPPSEPG